MFHHVVFKDPVLTLQAFPGEMVTMVDHGHHGIWWSTMVVPGRPSNIVLTMVVRPWSTVVDHDHGRPWSSHMTMFFSCIIASMNYVW